MDRFSYPDQPLVWLTDADIDMYSTEFEYSGFFGPLCRYRNVQRDWEDLQMVAGQPITVPSMFIGGDRDGPTIWGAAAIAAFDRTLPNLHSQHVLSGCGHWTQQERATEVNALLSAFLAEVL